MCLALSAAREFPERGMFAGYFFPGQRDRGLMLMWDAGAGARRAEEHARLRRGSRDGNVTPSSRIATAGSMRYFAHSARLPVDPVSLTGASVQVGNQLLPPTASGPETMA